MRRLALLLVGALAAAAPPIAAAAEPPRTGGFVAAAHPLAVEAGLEVLGRGGSALDAAVAVQVMLGLAEPQSSGIGGGGFIVHFAAATGKVTVYNGREIAPAGASAAMFLDREGRPMRRSDAMLSGRAIGAPGAIAVLHAAHRRHGTLPWSTLFEHTAALAERGFEVTPRLAAHIRGEFAQAAAPDVRAYFAGANGEPLGAGDTLRNPQYAHTLRRIAAEGPAALYAGPIAAAIVARARAEPRPGTLALEDLAAYRPEVLEPLCRPYRLYVVCVPPPPSSGVGLLYLLGLLERTDIDRRGPQDPQAWFLFAEASRIMYADRDHYVGDPRFVHVPVEGLLDPRYLDRRARLIGRRAARAAPPFGAPAGARVAARDRTAEPAGTSHFVVMDAAGDVVSMTTTIESLFGSGRMAAGFFLNNQMTDFSFSPRERDGTAAANAVAPGKRPRSSMTPAVVLDREGRFVAAVGSPGGNAIPAYVGKTLVGLIDWGLTLQQAIDLPNLVARGEAFNGESHKLPPQVLAGLRARGIEVRRGAGEISGLHGVTVRAHGLEGGADPRREGVARSLPASGAGEEGASGL